LQAGDLVYQVDDATRVGISKKLCSPWKGPFLVVKAKSPLYLIRNRKKKTWVHHDKLKECRFVPLWVRRARNKLLAAIDSPVDELPEDPLDQPIARPTSAVGGREKQQKKTPEPTNLVEDSTARWRSFRMIRWIGP
jgi:hypothetical protein